MKTRRAFFKTIVALAMSPFAAMPKPTILGHPCNWGLYSSFIEAGLNPNMDDGSYKIYTLDGPNGMVFGWVKTTASVNWEFSKPKIILQNHQSAINSASGKHPKRPSCSFGPFSSFYIPNPLIDNHLSYLQPTTYS